MRRTDTGPGPVWAHGGEIFTVGKSQPGPTDGNSKSSAGNSSTSLTSTCGNVNERSPCSYTDKVQYADFYLFFTCPKKISYPTFSVPKTLHFSIRTELFEKQSRNSKGIT
ncbi:hypothetical protein DPMN_127771 [Dreissena polymorpha]|uniref:Uncharacterized protein n=1 Tax=Dreissena polymorpha TaxID=45954 RepID=A0A9D4H5W4_DREPO|nr:hypothetical protein DPMN_127771 [Dreissena polymorpha]